MRSKNVKYLSSFLQLHNWGHSNTHLMACIYRNCLEALRPYHGILLLYEERELLDKLPLDASPTLKKMLSHASPTNSFRTIASDSDLALLHVRMSVKYIPTNIIQNLKTWHSIFCQFSSGFIGCWLPLLAKDQ